MGVWVEILKLGASGEERAAREKLASDLPLSLRKFVPSSEGLRQYRGPIPLAVRRFIANLPAGARTLAVSHECDFVDYILDDVCAEVERTLLLMELCHQWPGATLAELKAVFPWAPGLKRSESGEYRPVMDDLDRSRALNGRFIPMLRAAYNERVVTKVAARLRGRVHRAVEGGVVKIKVRY